MVNKAIIVSLMKSMFLKPRIGRMYQQGWNNYRTLVLGSHIPCLVPNCEFKELCCSSNTIFEMDNKCPEYAGKHDDSLRLSNANIIELEAYINGEANYPYYSAFTKNILGAFDSISKEKKESFWEYVTFSNYFQCFTKSSSLPEDIDYAEHIGALKELLEHLNPHPQIIYVWTERLCKFLNEHYSEIDGLRPLSKSNESVMQGCFVNCFAYKDSLEMEDVENSYKNNQTLEDMIEHLFPHGYTGIPQEETPFLMHDTFKTFEKTHKNEAFFEKGKKIFKYISKEGVEDKIFIFDPVTGRLKLKDYFLAAFLIAFLKDFHYTKITDLFSPGYVDRKKPISEFIPFSHDIGHVVSNYRGKELNPSEKRKIEGVYTKMLEGKTITEDDFTIALSNLKWKLD